MVITKDLADQHGALWSEQKIDLKESFRISAEIYLGTKDDGADGMALVFQAKDNQQVSTGGGIGYQGLSPSIAIEFDTYQNRDEMLDPVEDHVGVRLDGDPIHTGSDFVEVGNLEDGKYHPIKFEWNASQQSFTLALDGKERFYDKKISGSLLQGQQVYFGFTAATGLYSNEHKVRAITFSFLPKLVEHHYFHSDEKPHEAHWSYSGDTGPAHWGGLDESCRIAKTGILQSPIDIRDSLPAPLPELEFKYVPCSIHLINNDHSTSPESFSAALRTSSKPSPMPSGSEVTNGSNSRPALKIVSVLSRTIVDRPVTSGNMAAGWLKISMSHLSMW